MARTTKQNETQAAHEASTPDAPVASKRRGPGRPFQKGQSGNPSGRRRTLDPVTVTVLLRQIAERLSDAAALARGAVTCAESGSEAEAVRLSLDLDERLHDAEGLHRAVCLIARLQAEARSAPG